MKLFYTKYKIFIIPTVIGLICIGILGFVIFPQVLEYLKDMDQFTIAQNRIVSLNQKATELKTIDQATRQQQLKTALTILPTDRSVPQAMAALQTLVTKSNLVLKNTAYSAVSKSGETSFSFTITVLGPLSSIRNFLNSLSEGPRIFKVESIALRFQPGGLLAEADIPLSVFYTPAPTTKISLDQPVSQISSKQEELIAKLTKAMAAAEVSSTSSAVPLGKADPFQ